MRPVSANEDKHSAQLFCTNCALSLLIGYTPSRKVHGTVDPGPLPHLGTGWAWRVGDRPDYFILGHPSLPPQPTSLCIGSSVCRFRQDGCAVQASRAGAEASDASEMVVLHRHHIPFSRFLLLHQVAPPHSADAEPAR